MDFYRGTKKHSRYFRYKESFIHNTGLVASDKEKIIGVFEYNIKNIEEGEIINFHMFKPYDETIVLKGFINEMLYWNPYLKKIRYKKEGNFLTSEVLTHFGFKEDIVWTLNTNSNIEVFKIGIDKITPGQLTVSKDKLSRVNKWINKPEDIVITCMKIGDKLVAIDGHTRLVAAYNKGFQYVYAFLDLENDSMGLYKTCVKWCEEENILTIEDLANKVVTPKEHQILWINRCQEYLKNNK